MKKVILIFLILFLAGCITWQSAGLIYQQEQFNLLRREVDLRKADYQKRLNEIEQAYSNGKLTEGEYLMLKNNLKQEWHDYSSQIDRRISYIGQETIRLNHAY